MTVGSWKSPGSKMTRLFVKPVRATAPESWKPFACEPEFCNVLQLKGADPAVMTPLPIDDAQAKIPGPVAAAALMPAANIAWRITRFTGELSGFHTPTIGVVVAVNVAVLAVRAASVVIPIEYSFPRRVCS